MKKIKTKITNVYNRYLSLISKKTLSFFNRLKFSKNIKIKTSAFNQYLSITSKKILFFIIRLRFMKNSKVKIRGPAIFGKPDTGNLAGTDPPPHPLVRKTRPVYLPG